MKNHIIAKDVLDEVRLKIEKLVEFFDKLDALELLPEHEKQKELAIINNEVDLINRLSICGENELKLEVKKCLRISLL